MIRLSRKEPFADVWFPTNRWLRWGRALAQVDVVDNETGEFLYVFRRIRPFWFWLPGALQLFWSLWGEPWEEGWKPIDVRMAWEVACIVYLRH